MANFTSNLEKPDLLYQKVESRDVVASYKTPQCLIWMISQNTCKTGQAGLPITVGALSFSQQKCSQAHRHLAHIEFQHNTIRELKLNFFKIPYVCSYQWTSMKTPVKWLGSLSSYQEWLKLGQKLSTHSLSASVSEAAQLNRIKP